MKLEEAKVGRWIEHNESKARRFIAGVKRSGDIIIELKSGGTSTLSVDWFKDWTVLPLECDSFDWQPETFPQWWTTLRGSAETVAFVKRLNAKDWLCVHKDGGETPLQWFNCTTDGRTSLTEADALALLDQPEPVKPEIDPGEGYRLLEDGELTLPTDERKYRSIMPGGNWDVLSECHDKMIGVPLLTVREIWTDIVIRRKVEPVESTATRKVVLTEWLIECLDGDVITMWRQNKPFVADKEKLHAIGTREIEVPL
jgi:hypothetical protein